MLDRRCVAAGIAALSTAVALGNAPCIAEEVAGSAATLTGSTDPESGEGSSSAEVYDPLFGDDPAYDRAMDSDPYESANRLVFTFNEALDRWILDPITWVYQLAVPDPLRRGINRIFLNLNSPIVMSNELMQLRGREASFTLLRFVTNTSLGFGGFYDFAGEVMSVPRTEADFGQTLYRYGVPRGPYLVIPLVGPSSARDVLGTVVDQGLSPLFYLIGPLNLQWQFVVGGGQGLAVREANDQALEALRDTSVDFYSALRSAYLQSRKAREREVGLLFGGSSGPIAE